MTIVADLILLNGPPASGKSTVAAALVARRPLALNLDVDIVRGSLGQWRNTPADAGIAARRLAIAMATTHLGQGHDVVVPQFLHGRSSSTNSLPPQRQSAHGSSRWY